MTTLLSHKGGDILITHMPLPVAKLGEIPAALRPGPSALLVLMRERSPCTKSFLTSRILKSPRN